MPYPWSAGQILLAADLNTAFGTAAASWTPTWTNLTLGNATVSVRYNTQGCETSVWIKLTFGGTSAFTGTLAIGNLPVSAVYDAVGTLVAFDTSASGRFIGYCVASGSSISPIATAVGITSTSPMTWASGDTLTIYVRYATA